MAYRNDILAVTLEEYLREASDNTLVESNLVANLKKHNAYHVVDGGARLNWPVALEKHSTATALVDGSEAISRSIKRIPKRLQFDWAHAIQTIDIDGKTRRENTGKAQIIDYAKMLMENVKGDILNNLDTQIFAGTDPTGFAELETLNGDKGGWLQAAAFGSQTNTVGGILKSTYPDVFQNQWLDAGGALTGAKVQKLLLQCRAKRASDPYGLFLSTNALNALSVSIGTFHNYTSLDAQNKMAGTPAMMFAGTVPVFQVGQLDGVIYATTITDPLSGYLLNFKQLRLNFLRGAEFAVEGPFDLQDYDMQELRVIMAAQITTGMLSCHGIITDGNA